MNYITQIRHFWQLHEEYLFIPTEIALYFHLLEICNVCQWKNPFRRNNTKICVDLSISIDTLKRCRNKLQEHRLLTFESYSGKSEAIYTLTDFSEAAPEVTPKLAPEVTPKLVPEVTPEVVPEVIPEVAPEVIPEVVPEVIPEVIPEVAPTKDKLNKTKPNKTNVGSDTPPQRTFTPPTLEEVMEYCRERENRIDHMKFLDFYTSKGWMVGRSKMKDWRAAVRNWERSESRRPNAAATAAAHPAVNYQQQNFYDHDPRWNE